VIAPLPWYLLHASWLSLPLVALCLLAGRWLMLHLGGSHARSQAAEARAALGEPLNGPSAKDDGQVVTLRGELVVEDAPCSRYEDEAPAAACTMHVSNARTWAEDTAVNPHSDRRAERLLVATPDGRVPLVGPVTVGVGSRELWPAADIALTEDAVAERVQADADFDPRTFDGFAVFRSLREGDEVLARGRLVRRLKQGGGGGTYREQAASWELHADGEAIELSSIKPPKFTTKERIQLAGPGMAMAAVLFGYVWIFVDKDPSDAYDRCFHVCRDEGRCRPEAAWAGLGPGLSCERSAHPPCEHMTACAEQGQCVERDGACVAARDEDCRAIPDCRKIGRCSVEDGRCEITSAADCKRTEGCEHEGWCSVRHEGSKRYCGHGSDADCAVNVDCRLKGACSFRNGRCVAGKVEDCLRSRYCRDEGLCSFDGAAGCIAADDSDCRGSQACELSERCFAAKGICHARVPAIKDDADSNCGCQSDDLMCVMRCMGTR